MKASFTFCLLFTILGCAAAQPGQVLIHSHNDYDHARPFYGAYEQKAFSIEADVYLRGDTLLVAHQRKEIRPGNTLNTLYLQPIITLFAKYHGRPAADPHYTFQLMIDLKESWHKILPVLIRRLEQHRDCFDRSVNPLAVSVVISGNRPPDSTFHEYPAFIRFDGLPGRQYAAADLEKVAMISDNFQTYSRWNGKGTLPAADKATFAALVRQAHAEGKPIRFWGAPDTPDCWEQLTALGVDILNTDHVAACRQWLNGTTR